MQTTNPTTHHRAAPSTAPATAASAVADLQERSRELWSQDLLGIEMLLARGNRGDAAAALRTLLNRSDPDQARELLERAALQELAREVAWQQRAGQLPRRDGRWVPPSRVRVRRVRPQPAGPRRLAGDAAAAAYFAEHASIHDGNHDVTDAEEPRRNEPIWGGPDYDRAALPGVRGRACIGCRLERTRADRANRDGLCVHCREGGLTRELVIQRDCALVAGTNPGSRAVELLRAAWKRATRDDDRAVITAWVAEHTDLLQVAADQ